MDRSSVLGSIFCARWCSDSRNYTSNGFLKVSCNGGLNQMRSACDMVTVTRLLNPSLALPLPGLGQSYRSISWRAFPTYLTWTTVSPPTSFATLVVPELDKTSFWADPSNFEDIFYVKHFIDSLRDEVRIIKRLPKIFGLRYGYQPLVMPPVIWSSEQYYLQQDFLSEYDVTGDDTGKGSLLAALSEAGFIIGLEKNWNPHVGQDHLIKLLNQLMMLDASALSKGVIGGNVFNAAHLPTLLGTSCFSLLASYRY